MLKYNWEKIILFAFVLSFLLVRLPPLVLPLGLSTNILFRIIIFSIFFVLIFIQKKRLKITTFLLLSSVFFISQGLSVWKAINISNFFYFFEKISSAVIFLFVCQLLLNKKSLKYIINVIISVSVANVLLELILFFSPTLSEYVYKLIHPSVLHMLSLNSARNRLFLETTGEIFMPLLIYLYFFKKNNLLKKILLFVLTNMIFLLAFWSNFRDRFITAVFSLIGFIFLLNAELKKIRLKEKILPLLVFLVIITFGFLYINFKEGFSVIDRFLLKDTEEDVSTLVFRQTLLQESYQMFLSSPITGVGLGNFYDNMPQHYKNALYSYYGETKVFLEGTLLYPHNILAQIAAETGFLGLVSFIILLIYFIRVDWRLVKSKNSEAKSLILCFWLLMFYAMVSPKSTLLFFSTFFILRSLIEVSKD